MGGGLFFGQMWQPWGAGWNTDVEKATQAQHIKDGKVVTANTLDELVKKGRDEDFGKRAELLTPIVKPPFYAGKLASSLLAMSGGLHTDSSLHVLDAKHRPIEGVYVAGAAAGHYFGSGDYPTICPGMNHGRCLTFGRLAGIIAVGGDIDKKVKSIAV